jgi:hypothetical protein
MPRFLAVAAALGLLGAINMWGWLDPELLPPYDFPGYVTVAEDARNQLLRHGEIPAWNQKWFGGATRFMSSFKECLMLPLVLLFGGLRGVQATVYILKLAAGLAMYLGFARSLRAPAAGLVCGYAYAFSIPASYASLEVDVMVSWVLCPLIFAAALEMFRRRSIPAAVALGVLIACEFCTNLVHALAAPLTVLLLALLRPWRRDPSEDDVFRGGRPAARLALHWAGLTGLALAVFALFAASQIAWFHFDQENHAWQRVEYAEQAIHVFSEQSPLAVFNRADWLGEWLPRLALEHSPEDPLRGQRRYLGFVALAVCIGGWLAARRDLTLRRSYQLFALLFFVQWNLAMGPVSPAARLARTFGASETNDPTVECALAAAALACLLVALTLWIRRGRRWAPRLELLLGLALFFAFAAWPMFTALREQISLFESFRSPGKFMALLPFPFYAAFGLGLVAITRLLPSGRSASWFACAVLALLIVDFWPGRMAFVRGSSLQPVREFRELMEELPDDEQTGRIVMRPFRPPSLWIESSYVAVSSSLDSAWGWLPWQASPNAKPFLDASFVWLREDLPPQVRQQYREMGQVLGEIGRYRYFLDEHGTTPRLQLEGAWRLRERNERLALWQQPVGLPSAYGYRAYVLTLGDDALPAAFTIHSAHPLGLATIAAPAELSEDLLDGAALVLRLPGAAVTASALRQSPAFSERVAGRFVDSETPGFSERLEGFYSSRAPRARVPVDYRRPAPGHMQLNVDAGAEPAVIFVTEAHHPWWRVTLDAEAAPLLRAHMTFMAVQVGPGRHAIELRFEPPLALAGADRITALAWLALATLASGYAALALRRRRRPTPPLPRPDSRSGLEGGSSTGS